MYVCMCLTYSLISLCVVQVHKLKSLGSLSERIVYTRLLKLQDACELSKSFGILPPQNVVEEWKKYAHLSKVSMPLLTYVSMNVGCLSASVMSNIDWCILYIG